MKIKDKEAFSYELGVLMFNATEDKDLFFAGEYDVLGNFTYILKSLEDWEYEQFKDGFLAEAENYEIDKEEARQMFFSAIERIEQQC